MERKTCARCKCKIATVWMRNGNRCVDCFQQFMQRDLRVALGRAPLSDCPTALAVSGGFSSAALLSLYNYALKSKLRHPKQAPPRTVAFHVIISQDLGGGGASAYDIISELARKSNVEVIALKLPQNVRESLVMVRNSTDRTTLTRAFVTETVIRAAVTHSCDRVLFGDSATRVAIDVLTKTITGHGGNVFSTATPWIRVENDNFLTEEDAVLPTDRRSNVVVVKPLRDIQLRYCIKYMRLTHPDFVPTSPSDISSGMTMDNIHGIIERFVADTGEGNGSLVHNITRTAEKLKQSTCVCVLCGGSAWENPLKEDIETALNGYNERLLSKEASNGCCDECNCRGADEDTHLCHGCREALKRSDSKDENETVRALIEHRMNCIGRRARRSAMKQSIQSYLIENDSLLKEA